MKRYKNYKKSDKKYFSRTASKTNGRNVYHGKNPMRGGYRI